MWKSSIRGVVLNQIQFSVPNDQGADVGRVYCEVFAILDEIAWFHRIPILILATATTIFCVLRHGKKLDDLNQEQRQKFVANASKFPFWGLFHKLISSITLLHYFDNPAILRNIKLGSLRS